MINEYRVTGLFLKDLLSKVLQVKASTGRFLFKYVIEEKRPDRAWSFSGGHSDSNLFRYLLYPFKPLISDVFLSFGNTAEITPVVRQSESHLLFDTPNSTVGKNPSRV